MVGPASIYSRWSREDGAPGSPSRAGAGPGSTRGHRLAGRVSARAGAARRGARRPGLDSRLRPPVRQPSYRMARAVGKPLDRAGERGALRPRRPPARRAGHPLRLPGSAGAHHDPCAARGAAAAGRGRSLPVSLRRVRFPRSGSAGRLPTRPDAVAAGGRGSDPAGPCLLDVRVLLPLRPGRAAGARRLDAGGLGQPRGGPLADTAPRGAAGAPPRAGRRGPAHRDDSARLLQRALRFRRRVPGHDDPDRIHPAERRERAGHGGDRLAHRTGPARARAVPRGGASGWRQQGDPAGAGAGPAALAPPSARGPGLGARGHPAPPPPDPAGGVVRAGRYLDHRGDPSGVDPSQLRDPGARPGAGPPPAEQSLARDGRHARVGGDLVARGRAGRTAAGRRSPVVGDPPGAPLGRARNGVRDRDRNRVQRARALGRPRRPGRHRLDPSAGLSRTEPACHQPGHAGRLPRPRSLAGRGRRIPRCGPLAHPLGSDGPAAVAVAGRRRDPRLRDRAGGLRDLDRPVHLRYPTDLARDPLESAPVRRRGGRCVRRGPDGGERPGVRGRRRPERERRGMTATGPNQELRRLSVLIAISLVDMIGFAIVLPLLPFYALKLQATPSQVGLIIAAFSVAQILSAPVWGRLSDRYGRRPALLIGLLASAVAYLVFGVADALWLLFASRIVQGAGGGTTGVAQAYVADSIEPSQRAKALGWLSAATGAGFMVGPLIGSLASHFGQEAPGFIAAGLCIVNAACAWKWLPESKRKEGSGATPVLRKPVWNTAGQVVAHPARPASRLILIYGVGMLAYSVLTSVLALYLGAEFGTTERSIGKWFFYIGGIQVVMRVFLLGPIVDRIGEIWAMRAGTLTLVLGLFCLPLPTSVWVLAAIVPCVPVGTALLFPSTTALVSRHVVRSEYGTVMGVMQSFAGLAWIVGPILATGAF